MHTEDNLPSLLELIIHQRRHWPLPLEARQLAVSYQILFKPDRNLKKTDHQSWALSFGVLTSQVIFKASLILKVLVFLRFNY